MFAATLMIAAAAQAVAVVPAQAQAAHRLKLTPAQMFRLADIAARKGDLDTVAAIYRALELDADSDIRAEARFRYAKLLIGEKRTRDAALLLRRLVDEKPSATAARLALAQTLQLLGDSDGALRELRAAQSRGLPQAVARLIDRYSEALRASKAVGASLEIALAPDSNINRSTRSDTLGTIFGDFDINHESQAKSGMGVSLHGQAYRRIAIGGGRQDLLFRVSGSADLYSKTRFNDIALDFAGGPELRLGRNQLNLELGATQRWFGQKPFMRAARIGATWTRPIGSLTQLRLSGNAALIDNQFNDLEDGRGYSARVEVEHAVSPTAGIGFNLSADRETLKDPGYSTTGWRGGLIGWKDIGRMTFTAEADFGKLHADKRLVLFPDRRSDSYSRLSLGATFRQLQFRGFAPLTRLTIQRNRSSIAFYDYRDMRSEMGIVRAF